MRTKFPNENARYNLNPNAERTPAHQNTALKHNQKSQLQQHHTPK